MILQKMKYTLEVDKLNSNDNYVFTIMEFTRLGTYESEPFSYDEKEMEKLIEMNKNGLDPFNIINIDMNTYEANFNNKKYKIAYSGTMPKYIKNEFDVLKERINKTIDDNNKLRLDTGINVLTDRIDNLKDKINVFSDFSDLFDDHDIFNNFEDKFNAFIRKYNN